MKKTKDEGVPVYGDATDFSASLVCGARSQGLLQSKSSDPFTTVYTLKTSYKAEVGTGKERLP